MYQVRIRSFSDRGPDSYGSFPYEPRIGRISSLTRTRDRRSRRYLLYAGMLIGFCILLAFAGCSTAGPIGERTAAKSSISFGAVAVGPSGSATVTPTDGGKGAVGITQVEISGGPFRFAEPNRFPVTVPAGGARFVGRNLAVASGGVTANPSSPHAALTIPGSMRVPANAMAAGFAATISAVFPQETGGSQRPKAETRFRVSKEKTTQRERERDLERTLDAQPANSAC
jgi:hypothetical protein